MAEELFDRAEEYEAMLNQGIGLSGETQDFFIEGRVKDLTAQLPRSPRRILDFGCGMGKSCDYLARVFSQASVTGVDLSDAALEYARKVHGSSQVSFARIADLPALEPFDLCYVNGVFHHIGPEDRQEALTTIRRSLTPGGLAAIFENNPWNPGTRMVMSRIPFDRDAITLSFLELRRRMNDAGLEVVDSRFLFYMPRFLAALRFLEKPLVKVPLGAQYYVLGRAPQLKSGPA